MKYEEKEKLWLKTAKEISKLYQWNFKGHFFFKKIENFYFSATFYVSRTENAISGWLAYKPYNIDNVFWDIIDEQPNKNMPLSFRAESVFCVKKIICWDYNKEILDALNPQSEIMGLLNDIRQQVDNNIDKIKTLTDFQSEMLKDEKSNCVGIITAFIEQGDYSNAMMKIDEYKIKEINSGFRFGDKDFFDLAKEYCKKNNS